MATFDELFSEHTTTPAEREALVWHLAAYRARKTVEALLPGPRRHFNPEKHGIRLTPSQRKAQK